MGGVRIEQWGDGVCISLCITRTGSLVGTRKKEAASCRMEAIDPEEQGRFCFLLFLRPPLLPPLRSFGQPAIQHLARRQMASHKRMSLASIAEKNPGAPTKTR